jgi:GNAT superfamily N-acetyltransferase
MSTYRIFEVNRKKKRFVEKLAIWRGDVEINGQFVWCADGGEDEKTQCFALLDKELNTYVGFLGLTLSVDDLDSIVYAYVVVEFVYLHLSIRNHGLSYHFIECIIRRVEDWLNDKAGALHSRNADLRSASNIKSNAGKRFVGRLEERLGAVAASRQLTFSSCIDA